MPSARLAWLALPLLLAACGSDGGDACYSPTQNLSSAYQTGAQGCACTDKDTPVCALAPDLKHVGLMCVSGRWQTVIDGPCSPLSPDGGAPDTGPSDVAPDGQGTEVSGAAIDGGGGDQATSSFCSTCQADELCVVGHDGTCLTFPPRCVKKTADCTTATCSLECNRDICGANASCMAAPCPGTALYPGALHCYGP
jgi:hypothetical protein